MFTAKFWKDTAERVLATFVGALLAMWGTDGLDLAHVHWGAALSIAAGAAVLSLLKGVLAGLTVGGKDSASLSPSVAKPPAG